MILSDHLKSQSHQVFTVLPAVLVQATALRHPIILQLILHHLILHHLTILHRHPLIQALLPLILPQVVGVVVFQKYLLGL